MYDDVALGDPAGGGNTQIWVDVSWLERLNPTAAAATLKETVMSVTVELSLRIDAVILREVKRL